MATLTEMMARIEAGAQRGAGTLDLFVHDGTTVYADYKAGKKTHPDYVLYMRGEGLLGLTDRFSWVGLVDVVQQLDCREQTTIMAATVWGDHDVLAMVYDGGLPAESRESWKAAAQLVQAIIIQEQFNYPTRNGWWWTFHVFRCIGCGCPPEVVHRQVGSSADFLPRPQRCAECGRCDVRPWADPPALSRDLRNYYQAPGALTLRDDIRETLLTR
jgi:hypothetical protein